MKLPLERVGPYVRALGTGLHALAPNQDWPPLDHMLAHLYALDPGLSGELLLPAEVDDSSGMPTFSWLERVRAESRLASEGDRERSDAELERAERLDPQLGRRLRWRRDLHVHLRARPTLEMSTAFARARRLSKATEVLVSVDGVRPDGSWRRVNLVLKAPAGSKDLGCARVEAGGRIRLDPGLLHLVSRHDYSPLLALRAQIEDATDGVVRRVSRGSIGPFWFPGVNLPPGVPQSLGAGLCLHAAFEVVSDDIHRAQHRDPIVAPSKLSVPDGVAVVRDRRFACSPPVARALREWCGARDITPEINIIGPAA